MTHQSSPRTVRRAWLQDLLPAIPAQDTAPLSLAPLDIDSLCGALDLAEKRHPTASADLRIAIALDINATLRKRIRALGPMPALDPDRLAAALQAVETLQGRAASSDVRLRAALAIYAAPVSPREGKS